MLKKLKAFLITAILLGANSAAYAVITAPAVVGSSENPTRIDGRTIQPSIPPMPPLAEPKGDPEPKATGSKVSNKPDKKSGAVKKDSRARNPKAKTSKLKARRVR